MSFSKNTDFVIRLADLADCGGIYTACVESIRTAATKNYSREQVEAWVNRIAEFGFRSKVQRIHFIVAEAENTTIAGFAALNVQSREIEYVYVHPDYFGRGMGRSMLEKLECQARQHRIRKLHLIGSLNALGFYEHMGYAVDQTIERQLENVQIPCVMMSKRL